MRISQSSHRRYLVVKAHFWWFLTPKKELFLRSKKHQKCNFKSKYALCDDCDTLKSWLAISLRFLIFELLKKSLKFASEGKNVAFLLIFSLTKAITQWTVVSSIWGIVEEGSHIKLMNAGGPYASFVEQQLLAEEESENKGECQNIDLSGPALTVPAMAPQVSA